MMNPLKDIYKQAHYQHPRTQQAFLGRSIPLLSVLMSEGVDHLVERRWRCHDSPLIMHLVSRYPINKRGSTNVGKWLVKIIFCDAKYFPMSWSSSTFTSVKQQCRWDRFEPHQHHPHTSVHEIFMCQIDSVATSVSWLSPTPILLRSISKHRSFCDFCDVLNPAIAFFIFTGGRLII